MTRLIIQKAKKGYRLDYADGTVIHVDSLFKFARDNKKSIMWALKTILHLTFPRLLSVFSNKAQVVTGTIKE